MPKFYISVVFTLAVFSFFNILPFYLSAQKDLVTENLNGDYVKGLTANWHGQKINSIEDIVNTKETKNVLGDTSNKKIEIDLTNQKLKMIENGNTINDFLISSGKWGKTPTGTFTIWTKLRYRTMIGGNAALGTYYNLPNVPYVMFFYNDQVPKTKGYGIHGTYWHNNFGHPMSHGCINMKTEESGIVYNWAEVGTQILIYGTAPNN